MVLHQQPAVWGTDIAPVAVLLADRARAGLLAAMAAGRWPPGELAC